MKQRLPWARTTGKLRWHREVDGMEGMPTAKEEACKFIAKLLFLQTQNNLVTVCLV